MHTLVLIRHGQSQWNLENKFTGWVDVGLTQEGLEEAKEAGRLLLKAGIEFDLAYTSVLKRAIKTLWTVLEEMDSLWIPVVKDWHLNERHYGSLQGLNKTEMVDKFGAEQVKIWRRSYSNPPPPLSSNFSIDRRYQHLRKEDLPLTECLADTVARVVPYWEQQILPQIQKGKTLLIAAHGNSLRALVKHLDQISDSEITELNIPTGVPLVYKLDKHFSPLEKKYLGDPLEIERKIEGVAHQIGKK